MDEAEGWRKLVNVRGNDEQAAGKVDMVTGLESQPCCLCKSWEKDTPRLTKHFNAHGLPINAEGVITTPIVKDFPGRRVHKLKIQEMGWCRQECRPTEDLATCEKWRQVRTREEMRARMEFLK